MVGVNARRNERSFRFGWRNDVVFFGFTPVLVRADRIVVLRSGEIIEQGTHDLLLRAGGHYAELYNAYFRHQSLEYIQTALGGG